MRQDAPNYQDVQFLSDHTVIAPALGLRGKAAIRVSKGDRTDQERLERAEKALATLARFFPQWMDDELAQLATACEKFIQADTATRAEALQSFSRNAHNMRGNAYQFGYPVAARVAERLYTILNAKKTGPVSDVVLNRHMDAIRSILRFGPGENPTAIEIEQALLVLAEKKHSHSVKSEFAGEA